MSILGSAPLPGWFLAVAVLAVAGTMVWIGRSLSRASRAAERAATDVQRLRQDFGVIKGLVQNWALATQQDRSAGQVRKIAFVLTGLYTGDSEAGLPGAVVVRATNASDDFLHDLHVIYTPGDGNPQRHARQQLGPHSSAEWSFRLDLPTATKDQFVLDYTDSRGVEWVHNAADPVPRHRASGLEAWK